MTIIFQIIFELFRKLFRFFGPALIFAAGIAAAFIYVQIKTEDAARRDIYRFETVEVVSFEETRYDEETMDRVFRAVVRNNSPEARSYASLYITDEEDNVIYNSVRSEFDDLRISGNHTLISTVPPASDCVFEIHIDDYKLEGIDHIYISDLHSSEERGKRFDIRLEPKKK